MTTLCRRYNQRFIRTFWSHLSQGELASVSVGRSLTSKAEDLLDTGRAAEVENENQTDDYWSQFSDYNDWNRSQSKHAYRPKTDPRNTSILLFPGQGSQFVGMGKNLIDYPNVNKMYDVASDILKYDLLELCLNGPKEKLDKTVYCQPALLVTSLAAVEKLQEDNPKAIANCVGAAGFSVGEYAALVFSGALSFTDAVRLVKVRAEAMQKASEMTPSGMLTLFLTHNSKPEFACHTAILYCKKKLGMENPVCCVANYLYSDCKVIAGNIEALDFIQENASEFGLRKMKRLPVSGAFHTHLMRSALQSFQTALEQTTLSQPNIPVYSNVNSYKMKTTKVISRLLAEQIYKPVKWEQIIHVLYSRLQGKDFPDTYEVGPGKQLGTLLKLINKKAHEFYNAVEV